ncbi:uncharacterized protein N7518_009225 [Penicillium psychrosexuale]|uniref:uncharacterized protein n=1 Tax=Penicillium psychrosexuale TaxID=1002107 RepID=UPI0025459326|nr:uncharacterized protein N7518_009225 [Penicillium psychrosexuale]KAJ5783548.1 hypothetical protein N7518_009225 [Penicillium psychrosexuale]
MAKDQENGSGVNNSSDRPRCFTSTFQEVLFVLTATMAIGQQSFFQGCIVGVTASIGKDLHMNSAEITWINAGASLTSGAFLLTFGKLADMFGRKMLFTIGMGGFTISLLIAGFATNAIYMDVFSGILGLFAAAVVPPAVGALGATYEKPSKRKNLAFACFSAGNPLGFVGGMIISGVAAHLASWRASFWALAVVYGVFTVLTVWTVPADGFARTPLSVQALKQFDILGMALVVVGFAFFSSSLSLAADAPDGWKTGYVLALFIVGFFLLLAFLYWQSVTPHPLMPLWVWRDRNFSLLIGTCCLGFMGFSATSFYLALYLQNVKHLSALEITVQLLPMVVSGVLVNVVCGLLLHRVSNKVLTGIGALAYTASFLILSLMKQDATYWAFIFPGLVLVVVGADIQFNVTNMYVMSTLPPSEQSIAGGIFNTVNKLCSNLGLGIATSVQSSVALRMTASSPAIQPYLSVYWFAAAASGVSLVLVPFLTIGKQGNDVSQNDQLILEEAGEKTDVTAMTSSVVSSAVDITEHEKR